MKTTWKVLSASAFSAVLLAGTVSTTFVSAASNEQSSNGSNGRAAQVQQAPAGFGPGSQQQNQTQAKSSSSNSATAPTGELPAPPPAPANGEAPTPPAPPALPDGAAHENRVDGHITKISGSSITVERPTPPTPPTPPVNADQSTKATKTDKSVKTSKTSNRSTSVQRDTYGQNKPAQPLPSVGKDTYGGSSTVTVTDSTYIVKVSGDPKSGITETKLSLSDLNVGDHIAVVLASDSKKATRIEVREEPKAPANGEAPPAPPVPGKDAPTPPDAPPAPPVATNESTSSES
ncbi:hypothetical protein [Paenibacillus kandeliae]|uniref:hypothetical protein n=1 Tax=Paenibacillus kandeliae TaxID=3231269 RepID=UPI00345B3667